MSDVIEEILRKTDIDAVSFGVVVNYITNLQQENEYLKKHQRFHKKFGDDYIFCVEGDKETYKDLLLEKQEELEDYKSRCEKASEYMKYNATSNYFDKDKNMFRREIDLLNILQNGSDEE